jgi:hypothetical protein
MTSSFHIFALICYTYCCYQGSYALQVDVHVAVENLTQILVQSAIQFSSERQPT